MYIFLRFIFFSVLHRSKFESGWGLWFGFWVAFFLVGCFFFPNPSVVTAGFKTLEVFFLLADIYCTLAIRQYSA